ncbi:MAG: histidine kinase dimerization/phospho-acceptor domain-containing protein [Pseudomonadota bacterium]
MAGDPAFARLVSLACHDLRTPLATVNGFARTLARMDDLRDPLPRYLGMMATAAEQMNELLDALGLVARIEGERWEQAPAETDTLAIARAAAGQVALAPVSVSGTGAPVHLDAEAAERAVASFARCAIRHGGLEEAALRVEGPELRLTPVTPEAAPILIGDSLRDLGAAIALRVVDALGGSAELDGEALLVRLPVSSD